MRQKQWNYLTAVSILAIAAGFLWISYERGGMMGRLLIVAGVLLFVAGIVGSSRASAKRPFRCPVCGKPFKPAGRWFPGVGYNGTDTIFCPHCGALVSIQDLKREEP